MAETYYFSGVAKWAKVYKHNMDKKFGDRYTICVYLDELSKKKYEMSGIQTALKEDEEGQFAQFKRNDKQLIKGELVEFGPPEILGMDGIDALIGNGSEVTVRVQVFDTVKGKGSRLEKVRVDTLVPFAKADGVGAEGVEVPF